MNLKWPTTVSPSRCMLVASLCFRSVVRYELQCHGINPAQVILYTKPPPKPQINPIHRHCHPTAPKTNTNTNFTSQSSGVSVNDDVIEAFNGFKLQKDPYKMRYFVYKVRLGWCWGGVRDNQSDWVDRRCKFSQQTYPKHNYLDQLPKGPLPM